MEKNPNFLLIEDLRKKIQKDVELKDWSALEKNAKTWIRYDSNSIHGFKWLARASFALKKYDRAHFAYGRVLDFDSENAEARKFIAENPLSRIPVIQKIEDSKEKEEENQELLSDEVRLELSESEYKNAAVFEKHARYLDAAKKYEESFAILPDPKAALGVARSYFRASDYQQCINFIRKRLFKNSEWHEGRILIGRAFFELGQIHSAQREWQLVLQQDPNNKEAFRFLQGLIHRNSIHSDI